MEKWINCGGPEFQVHSSPTRPTCLHSSQLKVNMKLRKPIILHHKALADWVQAWPKPLTGAGPIQNLHQVVVDEAVQRAGEYVRDG